MACRYPLILQDKMAPCGKCTACIKRRVDGWVFRIMQEEKRSSAADFVTLTYENEQIITTPNGYATLIRAHAQRFFKKLRKLHYRKYKENSKIKYYICGEYGSQNRRPHYHAIILNGDKALYEKAWTDSKEQPRGAIHLGDKYARDAVAYTIGYMNKGRVVPEHKRDDREPEFANMSKGIGLNYLTDEMIKWHKQDLTRAYAVLEGGHKIALPRYLKDKIYTEEEKEQQMELIIPDARKTQQELYRKHLKKGGTTDTYVKEMAENRKAERENFKNQQKERTL